MSRLELYGASGCPYTQDLREWLEWRGRVYTEYDVETDAAALERLRALSGGTRVPALVEDGRVTQTGWQGRACVIGERGAA